MQERADRLGNGSPHAGPEPTSSLKAQLPLSGHSPGRDFQSDREPMAAGQSLVFLCLDRHRKVCSELRPKRQLSTEASLGHFGFASDRSSSNASCHRQRLRTHERTQLFGSRASNPDRPHIMSPDPLSFDRVLAHHPTRQGSRKAVPVSTPSASAPQWTRRLHAW